MAQGDFSSGVLSRDQIQMYAVNRQNWEAIKQTLYDWQAYAAAGQTQLSFFQVPVGQSGKTLSDTNMNLAGNLPAGQEFLVQSIEVPFLPTVPAVAADNPAAFGAQAVANIVNDVYKVYRTGNLQFNVLSKNYLTEAPLGRFPGKTQFDLAAAVSDIAPNGAGTDEMQTRIAFAKAVGRPYVLDPMRILLVSNQNFIVTLNWPEGLQTITNPGRIGVILDGTLYRRSQ